MSTLESHGTWTKLGFPRTRKLASARDEFQPNLIAKAEPTSANMVGCLERVKGIDSSLDSEQGRGTGRASRSDLPPDLLRRP